MKHPKDCNASSGKPDSEDLRKAKGSSYLKSSFLKHQGKWKQRIPNGGKGTEQGFRGTPGEPKPQGDPSPPTGSNKKSSRTQGPWGHSSTVPAHSSPGDLQKGPYFSPAEKPVAQNSTRASPEPLQALPEDIKTGVFPHVGYKTHTWAAIRQGNCWRIQRVMLPEQRDDFNFLFFSVGDRMSIFSFALVPYAKC